MKVKLDGYSIQKRKGKKDLAFVRLNDTKYHLGLYGSQESCKKYNRIMSEYYANGGNIYQATDDLTVVELCKMYNDHAIEYYRRPDGTQTSEVSMFQTLAKILCELYGRLTVSEFSPLKLEAVRGAMIKKGWSRKNINTQISRVRMIFSFGVRKECVNVSVLEALKTVRGLARGRSAARETEKIKPVPVSYIEAVMPWVSRQVWAMIQLQLHTAARPGEICMMRLCDIDMSADIWVYTPDHCKWRRKSAAPDVTV